MSTFDDVIMDGGNIDTKYFRTMKTETSNKIHSTNIWYQLDDVLGV